MNKKIIAPSPYEGKEIGLEKKPSKRGSMGLPNKAPTMEEWVAFKEKQDGQRRRMSFYKKLQVISQMMERSHAPPP